jgi:hypothetical protein
VVYDQYDAQSCSGRNELYAGTADVAACAAGTTQIAVLAVILGKFVDMERSIVPEASRCARQAEDIRC